MSRSSAILTEESGISFRLLRRPGRLHGAFTPESFSRSPRNPQPPSVAFTVEAGRGPQSMAQLVNTIPPLQTYMSVAAKKGTILAAMAVSGPQHFNWSLSLIAGRAFLERPGAVKGAPLLGAAKRTLDSVALECLRRRCAAETPKPSLRAMCGSKKRPKPPRNSWGSHFDCEPP
jgi:hypothetical protein